VGLAEALRASVGLGISWISPLGPLRIAYAKPVRPRRRTMSDPPHPIYKDRIQQLQFQIGTSF
jgi:outer membrane protein insertion porin family